MIKGMDINLITLTQTGTDPFGEPIFTESSETVSNVLVGEPSPEEKLNELNLNGKAIAYTLGIPKGDTHEWEGQIVEMFGERFMVYGIPVQGIEANIPLSWHKKVKVERYE